VKFLSLLAVRIYRILLYCYPPGFRVEFMDEMQNIFETLILDASQEGSIVIARSLCRELKDWPSTVLQEHLHSRRGKMFSNKIINEKPLTLAELLAAMIIFVLPILSISLNFWLYLPQWASIVLVVLFWSCVIFAVGLAITKKLPRWSVSYLGFLTAVCLVFSRFDQIWTSWLFPIFIESFGPRSMWALGIRIIYGGSTALIHISSILLGALILVNLLRMIPFTRRIWHRIRADWTHLSFLVYGSLVFLIIIAFEGYRYDEIWKIGSWVSMAIGGWLYIRAKRQKQRILTLIGGATGAMWIVAIGTWVLIPLQNWERRYSLISMRDLRWTNTSIVIIGWICILLVMIAPALLNFVPHTPPPDDQENVAYA